MSTTIIPVRTPALTYHVEIGSGLLPYVGERVDALLGGALSDGKAKVFVVTSPEIARLWAEPLLAGFPTRPQVLTIPAGEEYKRLATLEELLEQLAEGGADRDTVLIALGGGVIGDMTGFLAAIYMRGIRYIGVPTTALAQIDSSLGGKTGANLAAGKNLVGAFHHPLAVYSDIDVLATLPAAELRAGLQEAVKAGIIRDRSLFEYLDTHSDKVLAGDPAALHHVVAASVQVKADVVAADERESGLRMLLNLGHTLGHAIEAATHYKQLLHGEAVAWGMLAAIAIAKRRGMIPPEDYAKMDSVIRAYGPVRPFTADASHLVALTAKDKKHRGGTRSFVLPTSIGTSTVVKDVTEAELLPAAEAVVNEAAGVRA